jgi:hypothetical protein
MSRFLIELEHEANVEACKRAVMTILTSGSHFLTNAEWGCEDGVHKCCIIVDMDSKEEARAILPPVYRKEAHITQVKRYTLEKMKKALKEEQY